MTDSGIREFQNSRTTPSDVASGSAAPFPASTAHSAQSTVMRAIRKKTYSKKRKQGWNVDAKKRMENTALGCEVGILPWSEPAETL
ncbi:hypothetical protein M407DRAFT_246511, partial [Tulasnella calospora MUT 4182]